MRKDGSLDDFPILKCWPEDGGRYITLPLVFTRDPGKRDAEHRHLSHAGLRRPHRPACTGSATKVARSTIASPSGSGSRLPVAVALGPIPR